MNPTTPLLLGVEIGGTKLQLGVGTGEGRLIDLARFDVDPAQGGAGIRAQIEEAGADLLRNHAGPGSFDAIGIGFGGPVDAKQGIVTVSNQIAGWADFALVDWFRETFGANKVALQNDADTAALGEARFGAGRGASPILYVTVGSGIGGGLVIDGQIYRGSGHGALEIGHLLIEEGSGGSPLSLENIASGWSIARDAQTLLQTGVTAGLNAGDSALAQAARANSGKITTSLVAQAAEAGDPIALGLIARAAGAMSKALAHAVTLLAPERIIVGGGVSLMNNSLWLEPIRRQVDQRVFPPFKNTYAIVPPELGEEVVVHGALALAADVFKS